MTPVATQQRQRHIEPVKRYLRGHPNVELSYTEIAQAIGVPQSKFASVRGTLNRLAEVKDSGVERTSQRGWFIYRPEKNGGGEGPEADSFPAKLALTKFGHRPPGSDAQIYTGVDGTAYKVTMLDLY